MRIFRDILDLLSGRGHQPPRRRRMPSFLTTERLEAERKAMSLLRFDADR